MVPVFFFLTSGFGRRQTRQTQVRVGSPVRGWVQLGALRVRRHLQGGIPAHKGRVRDVAQVQGSVSRIDLKGHIAKQYVFVQTSSLHRTNVLEVLEGRLARR